MTRRVPHLGRFRLDGWSVHPAEGTLSSDGGPVRLEPRVMDVLVYLAAEPGEVVSKEDLLEAVWGGAYVEEGVLTQAIHSLRKALGDDARQPRFILTIPKRGYRLVASVSIESAGPVPVPEPVDVPVEETTAFLPATASSSRRLAWVLGGTALLAVLLFLVLPYARTHRSPEPAEAPAPVAPEGRRIVVLPFEDLNQPADPFFAKGLTEEITNDLSSLAALEVISRTSARQYAGAYKPLPEIGKELKVDYVVEGTVQWGRSPHGHPQARIRPRLVRAADDVQVWSGQFDTGVEDIFSVQSEISRRVSEQLGILLTSEEKRALSTPPTENLEAYQAYQRGLELKDQPFYSSEHVFKSVSMFERATNLDPGFADAWAELSRSHCYLAFNTDRSPARVDLAQRALVRATALDPDLLSVRLARVYFSYRCMEHYSTALDELTETARHFPNNAEVLQTRGFLLRREGRFREAAEVLQHAYTLDPKTVLLVWATGETYRALRNYEEADHFFRQAISLAPDEPVYWEARVYNRLDWKGDLAEARAILAQAPVLDHPRFLFLSFELDFYARDYKKALSRLTAESLHRQDTTARSQLSMLATIARDRIGDHRGTLAIAEANRVELEDLVRRFPKEPLYPALLAIALARLGRSDEACALAEKTARANARDRLAGPDIIRFQAIAEAILGRRRQAINRLSRLLTTSYRAAISVNELRLSPVWDPLRGDPEFEALLRGSSS